LVGAVQRNLNNPGEFSDKRMALTERLLYNRGKGAEAAADAITEFWHAFSCKTQLTYKGCKK